MNWLRGLAAPAARGGAKVFCIGFNKTGTTSLHALFGRVGLSSVHNIAWPVQSHTEDGRAYFAQADCYTDGEQASFHSLEAWFPDAVFILNTRDERSWLRSRLKHVLRFGVPTGESDCPVLRKLGGMAHEFFACPEMALAAWISQRRVYEQHARQHFAGKPNFLELRVTEDRDWAMKVQELLVANQVLARVKPLAEAPDANKRDSSEIADQRRLAEYMALADHVLEQINRIEGGTAADTRIRRSS
ncbi:sulfotransferase [Albidovulum sediminicola]|uniref:Sulfotransferase family protein n=1 Tax=Albidovulum sediminicola TaxID=2984331 RepID=A0ABT2Z483_9RHOB|nr:sulfotransferase [Defluviimonas sp. WL0075]MCV2865938.1 hypothetical protein [Defluviimonas sp. WL0075]